MRSPSGDIDITVIMIGIFRDHSERCYLDFGSGKYRRGLPLAEIEFEPEVKESLIGFHAFTGNDYVSSFYRKGKGVCWSALEKIQDFCQHSKIWDQPGSLQKKHSSYLKDTYVYYTVVERRT